MALLKWVIIIKLTRKVLLSMKILNYRILTLLATSLFVLSSCGEASSETTTSEGKQYTVTFMDGDGSNVLDIQSCAEGGSVTLGGNTPTKEKTIVYSYSFAGSWLTSLDGSTDALLTNIVKDQTVYPKFSESKNAQYSFGYYPQTLVSDSTIITSLNRLAGSLPVENANAAWTDYAFYINGVVASFMWFQDVNLETAAYRGVYFTKYRPNHILSDSTTSDTLIDNYGYQASKTYWFKYEPIVWDIGKIDNALGKVSMLSNKVLDSTQYYSSVDNRVEGSATYYPNNYVKSDLYSWLTKTFFNNAFSAAEQESIVSNQTDNSAASTGNTLNQYACENKTDQIFIPSYAELNSNDYGMSTSASRIRQCTDYAKILGVVKTGENAASWWTRSPSFDSSTTVRSINTVGQLSQYDVRATCVGVLPAIWVNLG